MSDHPGASLSDSLVASYEMEWTCNDRVLPHMIQYHLVHQIISSEAGIVPEEVAARLCRSLRALRAVAASDLPFDPRFDGLHPCLEARIRDEEGPDVAGWLNAGRARQEIEMVARLLTVRHAMIQALQSLCRYREAMIHFAERECETVIPWQTWLQPAEVASVGYVIEAYVHASSDDFERIMGGLLHTNRSRLQIGQVVPPPFSFDRDKAASMLGMNPCGFPSSIRAYAAADTECALIGDMTIAAGNLTRLAETLYLWCSAEFGLTQFGDSFTGTSHIMPQKRNPYALRNIRPVFTRISGRYQDALNLFTGGAPAIGNGVAHIPNRTIECADDLSLVLNCAADAIETLTVDKSRGDAALKGTWCQAPQLVFTLVRNHGIPFRSAHTLVAELVKMLKESGRPPESLASADISQAGLALLGKEIVIDEETLAGTMNPLEIINSRAGTGPAPAAVRQRLSEAKDNLINDRTRLQALSEKIDQGNAQLNAAVDALTRKHLETH